MKMLLNGTVVHDLFFLQRFQLKNVTNLTDGVMVELGPLYNPHSDSNSIKDKGVTFVPDQRTQVRLSLDFRASSS